MITATTSTNPAWPRAWWEYSFVASIAMLLVVLLVPALWQARTAARDDLRQTDIANLKHALEMYNNKFNYYVSAPTDMPTCTSSSSESWFFGPSSPLLKTQVLDAIPHDVRENQGRTYTYCVTVTDSQGRASGFYVQAQLEAARANQVGFDEDENRKYNWRILNEDGQTLYRVCGGSEKQCAAAS